MHPKTRRNWLNCREELRSLFQDLISSSIRYASELYWSSSFLISVAVIFRIHGWAVTADALYVSLCESSWTEHPEISTDYCRIFQHVDERFTWERWSVVRSFGHQDYYLIMVHLQTQVCLCSRDRAFHPFEYRKSRRHGKLCDFLSCWHVSIAGHSPVPPVVSVFQTNIILQSCVQHYHDHPK